MATIVDAGEFSAFPGRDRTLVVGRGRLELAIAARGRQRLVRGDRVDFAGEVPVTAGPVGGPVAAVNVMTDRARCAASVRIVRVAGAAPDADALVLLAGPASLQGEELNPFDAALRPGAGLVRGAGALMLAVSISEGLS